ncbi:putative RNA-directed DNA polymerase [Rosa chinensis]|uniref:Putative RNA-directed DNA polymerase n=1 Tax=Rosa chinensis TaxID=74649 RepID=A0A2P6PYH2_ROSCH|nr:putative RNA-directed DNA polymerase [Rosa chinensis]
MNFSMMQSEKQAMRHSVTIEFSVMAQRKQGPPPGFSGPSPHRPLGKPNPYANKRCIICGELGHSKERCYEVIGYPDWWDFTKKPRKNLGKAAVATKEEVYLDNASTNVAAVAQSGMKGKVTFNSTWIIDTGASDHMTNDPSLVKNLRLSPQDVVSTADGTPTPVTGEGSIALSDTLTLESDILTRRILGYGVRRGKLYYLDLTETGKKQKHLLGQANQINGVENAKEAVWLWHRRLGHLSFRYLKKLQPQLFSVVSDLDFHCDICELAKSHRISYSPSLNKSLVPFMKIHSDVWGPAKISSLSGARYFVTFIDDCTRMTWVSLPKNKSDVFGMFTEFHKMVATQYQQSIRVFQSDNGREFDALTNPKWTKAMNEELEALQKNATWELVPMPVGKKTVGGRWVFTVKLNADGTINRYKARLVAKGYTQRYGIDYKETFAPVAKINTVRILISLAANKDWPLHQFDVKNAFLNGNLEEEVYMDMPQSPRAWFGRFSKSIKAFGYKQSNSDHTLFIKRKNAKITALIVYVDDMIVTGDDPKEINELQKYLSKESEMKDLGQLKYFLGIEVARSKKGISLSQRKYVLDLLAETGMLDCRPIETPIEMNHGLAIYPDQVPTDKGRYQRLVGRAYGCSLSYFEIGLVIKRTDVLHLGTSLLLEGTLSLGVAKSKKLLPDQVQKLSSEVWHIEYEKYCGFVMS